jgi:hypothetical protein
MRTADLSRVKTKGPFGPFSNPLPRSSNDNVVDGAASHAEVSGNLVDTNSPVEIHRLRFPRFFDGKSGVSIPLTSRNRSVTCGVCAVFNLSSPREVSAMVVHSISVQVPDKRKSMRVGYEGFCYKPVNSFSDRLAAAPKAKRQVLTKERWDYFFADYAEEVWTKTSTSKHATLAQFIFRIVWKDTPLRVSIGRHDAIHPCVDVLGLHPTCSLFYFTKSSFGRTVNTRAPPRNITITF